MHICSFKVRVHTYASYVSYGSYETDFRIISIVSYTYASTDRQGTDRTYRPVGNADDIDRRGNLSHWCGWRHIGGLPISGRVLQLVVTVRLTDHLNFVAFRHSVHTCFNYNIFIILIIIIITHIMDIARLITIVQEYEELYNLKHPHYSDRPLATKMRMLLKKIRPSHRQYDCYRYRRTTTILSVSYDPTDTYNTYLWTRTFVVHIIINSTYIRFRRIFPITVT
jgi:hypothetical protein